MKGNATNIGLSIIIPSDIRIEAITISMTRKGKNSRKPIWNADFSSEVMKAGSTIVIGTSALSSKLPSPAISENITKSFSRVLRIMKDFIIVLPVDMDLGSAIECFASNRFEEMPVIDPGAPDKVIAMLRRQDVIATYNARLMKMRTERE